VQMNHTSHGVTNKVHVILLHLGTLPILFLGEVNVQASVLPLWSTCNASM